MCVEKVQVMVHQTAGLFRHVLHVTRQDNPSPTFLLTFDFYTASMYREPIDCRLSTSIVLFPLVLCIAVATRVTYLSIWRIPLCQFAYHFHLCPLSLSPRYPSDNY